MHMLTTDLTFLELRSTQLSVFKLYSRSALHFTFHFTLWTRLPRAFIIELKRCVHQVPFHLLCNKNSPPFSLSDETWTNPKWKLPSLVMSPEILNPEFKVETLNSKTFESEYCRANGFLLNPDIFLPAIF